MSTEDPVLAELDRRIALAEAVEFLDLWQAFDHDTHEFLRDSLNHRLGELRALKEAYLDFRAIKDASKQREDDTPLAFVVPAILGMKRIERAILGKDGER